MMRVTLGLLLCVAAASGQSCSVADPSKTDCGYEGITQGECEGKGCCWQPINPNPSNYPWCFDKSGGPTPPGPSGSCPNLNGTGGYGFTDSFYTTMQQKYESQLNVQGCGAVVASPDKNTPGGSYYYHWMRDGALSMWAYMKINNYSYDAVQEKMNAYQGWVQKVQNENDPNGNSVLIEPKFNIPSGAPYTGGWCRPQTDGPGLRANTMTYWATVLMKAGKQDQAKNNVWPLIQKDLGWVTSNWQSNGCDLWEEVRSNDFFWGRMGFVHALKQASSLAADFGDNGASSQYASTANSIYSSLSGHWNGNYLIESSNRQMDGSVVHAIASFAAGNDTSYGPLAGNVAKTLTAYEHEFCNQFPINQRDTVPGVMIGRYPGDHYAGGNPWQLLTAILAQVYYRSAKTMQQLERQQGSRFTLRPEHDEWRKHLKLPEGADSQAFASAAISAGDAVMQRLWSHVKNDGGRIDEQIDKNSGAQTSAQSLTWSYANILETIYIRKSLSS